jgi:hypothetical protein
MNFREDNFKSLIDKEAKLAYEYEQKYFGCAQTTGAGIVEAFGIGGKIFFALQCALQPGSQEGEKYAAP